MDKEKYIRLITTIIILLIALAVIVFLLYSRLTLIS